MKRISIVLLAMAILLVAGPALAQSVGQFTEVQGKVSVKRANGQMANVALKTQVFKGDVITTDKGSKGTVLFKDGSVIRIGPSTKLTITNHVYQEEKGIAQAAYEVASGTIMSVVGSIFGNNESEYKVKTPTSVSGVRGTMFIVHVATNAQGQTTTQLVGVEGHVNFSGNNGGSFDVGGGQMSTVGPDGLATGPVAVDDAYMQELLGSITVGTRSVNERAEGVRGSGDLLPGAPMPEGTSVLDLVTGIDTTDNPADLIYQEPPNAVELIINITIGAPV